MDEKEKKMYQFQMLQANIEEIKKRLQKVLKSYEELELAKQTLKEIKSMKKSPTLIPIGMGNFIPGQIDNVDKIIVDMGGGLVLSKTPADALKNVDKQIEEVKKVLTNLTMQEQMIQQELAKLQPEIQKMMTG